MGAYGGLRLWVGVGSALVPSSSSWGTVARQAPGIAATYGSLLAWPWPLTPARHVHYLPPLGSLLLGCLLAAAALGLATWYARHRRLALAGLVLALLAFLPTLVATLDKGLLGERYLYLPLAGLALTVAAALPLSRRVVLASLVVAAAFVLVLCLRLPQWKSSATLWRAADAAVSSPFTQAGLAWYLRDDGQPEEALELVVASIRGEPPYHDACAFLGMIPLELQRPDDAVRLAAWGLDERGCPPSAELLGSYAVALAGLSRWEEAMAVAQRPELGRSGTGQVVLAAGMLLQGNQLVLRQYAQRWPGGEDDFVQRVIKLLRLSGQEVHLLEAPPSAAPSPADGQQPQQQATQP